MRTVLVAGAFGSGTSAVAGALHHMGISTVPPHFHTNDPRTPNSYESLAFREIVQSFADEMTLSVDSTMSGQFVRSLRIFLANVEARHQPQMGDAPPPYIALKYPVASICLNEIVEALDPAIILVDRSFEEIEATRMRRRWATEHSAAGAHKIYSKARRDLAALGRDFVDLSFDGFLAEPEQELLRMLDFCQITDRSISSRIPDALKFVRAKNRATTDAMLVTNEMDDPAA